ncbi:MAG TPA: DUF1800 family protein [Terriglobales bacterium]|nr:DUF1800 family protein [Terriglobales bacterium]
MAALVIAPLGYLAANDKDNKKKSSKTAVVRMDGSKKAVHALNRLTFGPRPGEVEKVAQMGVDRWIEQQLNPEKIDDSALQAKLDPLRTLKMDSRELVENFPPPQVLKAIAEGRMEMPRDPKKKAVYEAQVAAYKARLENRAKNGDNNDVNPQEARPADMNEDSAQEKRREERRKMLPSIMALMQKTPEQRVEAIMKMEPNERRQFVQLMTPAERERLTTYLRPEEREMLQAIASPQGAITNELIQAKLLRAIYSERQLEEVMADFWFNHFNVFIGKGADRYLVPAYERDTIRKHALGKFEDLLVATAKDPAMLFYLDNFQSVGPNSMAGKRSGQPRGPVAQRLQDQRRNRRNQPNANNRMPNDQQPMMLEDPSLQLPVKRGLNENYARELMELHTLGVEGGYTQQDIVEVAKVFTGWTVRQPRQGGDFDYNDRIHEPGSKVVLGQKIDEAGESEGRKVLHMLAAHPSTAKFISRKLAMRFVADNPSQALVDNLAATFLKSNGDIKQVLRTLFQSPDFWAQDSYRAKVKTPLEFVVSAVRVTGTEVRNPLPLAQTLNKLGMPLYGAQPPTGYSMKAEAWVNSAALLNRMNFALGLAGGQVRGLEVQPQRVIAMNAAGDSEAALEAMSKSLLAGDVSKQTTETIRKQMAEPQYQAASAQVNGDEMAMARPRAAGEKLGVIAGLILGSPEFQRR